MRGFTLVELLISVALLGIVAGVGGNLLLTSIRSYNKSQILNTLSQNGDFALSTLKNEVQNAQSASCSGPTLNVVNQSGNTIIYSITTSSCPGNNGSFMRGSDYLLNTQTSPTVSVIGGSFTCAGNLVTATLTLAQACGTGGTFDSTAQTTLTTSVLVRGAYR